MTLHSTVADASVQTLLAIHARTVGRGARIVDETHWDGLPTGAGRRDTPGVIFLSPVPDSLSQDRTGRCRPC